MSRMNAPLSASSGPLRNILAALIIATLTATACGSSSSLDLEVVAVSDVERLDDLTRLDYRVYTVEDVDEILATATNPNGTPVQAISCEILKTAAPDATDCTETERRVTRDQDLLETGPVPADGRLTIKGGQRVRVYASLRPDQLVMDEHGHFCSWTGNQVFETTATAGEIQVRPFC